MVVSNATLHNEDEIKRKDIRIGDTIMIQRAGDVIPQVLTIDKSKRKQDSKKFNFPNKCLCGAETKKELSFIKNMDYLWFLKNRKNTKNHLKLQENY